MKSYNINCSTIQNKSKTAVIVFPGTNCEIETAKAIEIFSGEKPDFIYSNERIEKDYELIVLPGGFSYGDYLRPGSISSMLPLLEDIKLHAENDRLLLGVCNGFQILTECGMLPGVLMKNDNLKFICKDVELEINDLANKFTSLSYKTNAIMPVAHGYGKYYCDEDTLGYLRNNNMIALTYKENINGSTANIAGITNRRGNVLGMMPHPERAVFSHHSSLDGRLIFASALKKWLPSKKWI